MVMLNTATTIKEERESQVQDPLCPSGKASGYRSQLQGNTKCMPRAKPTAIS